MAILAKGEKKVQKIEESKFLSLEEWISQW